jgi:transcriptional regulator with XRE-family HTH domain
MAQRIKYYRKKSGVTIEKVADALGMQSPNYLKYESGERNPKDDKLLALSKLFDIPYSTLHYGVEQEFIDLLYAHSIGAILNEFEGFCAFQDDVSHNNEAYEIITDTFKKGEILFLTQKPEFYNKYLAEPNLKTIIELHSILRQYETEEICVENDDDFLEAIKLKYKLDEQTIYKLAFCIAVWKYLFEYDGDTALAEAKDMTDENILSPLQYFAVKAIVPCLAYIISAVDLTKETNISDFELAFLYDAITPPAEEDAE